MRREKGREYYGQSIRDGAYLIGDDKYANAEEFSSMVEREENVSVVYHARGRGRGRGRGRRRGRGNYGYYGGRHRRNYGYNYQYNNESKWNDWE